MKTTLTSLATLMIALTSLVSANAQGNRTMESHAYEMLGQARELRWLVHDNEASLPNAHLLCREVDDIYSRVRNFDDGVFRERHCRFLVSDLDRLERCVNELQSLLGRCGTPVPTNRNLSFGDVRFSVGHSHRMRNRSIVPTIQQQANALQRTIDCTRNELNQQSGLSHAPIPSHHGHGTPVPNQPVPTFNPPVRNSIGTPYFPPSLQPHLMGPETSPKMSQHKPWDRKKAKPTASTARTAPSQAPFIEWNGYRLSFSPKH